MNPKSFLFNFWGSLQFGSLPFSLYPPMHGGLAINPFFDASYEKAPSPTMLQRKDCRWKEERKFAPLLFLRVTILGGMWGSNQRTKTPNISLCILLIFSKLVFQFLGNWTDFISVVSRFFRFRNLVQNYKKFLIYANFRVTFFPKKWYIVFPTIFQVSNS